MIIFKDWNITATPGVIARQFDHKTRRLEMTGDMPTGWEWTAEFRYGDFMDVFLLEPMEGGFGIDLTADQLCFPGNYKIQVRGIRGTFGEEIRYTNEIRVFIPENLAGTPDEDGEANWPEVTSEFKQLESRIWGSVDTAKGHAEDAQHSAEQAADHMGEAGKYAELSRKYADLVNPDEIRVMISQRGNNLEYDTEEGLLYLMADGNRIGDGVKVATGGGPGGGTSSDNNAVMSISNETGWLYKTLSYGSPCPIIFEWSSLEEGLSTGPGVLKITVNSTVKATMEIQQGEQPVDIWPWLDPGTNVVSLRVTDTYGNSRVLNFTVQAVKLTIESDFNSVLPCRGNDLFRYTPTGYYEKTVHFIMDGEEIDTATVTASGTQLDYFIPAQAHGAHTFEVYFDVVIEGSPDPVPSNRLQYRIICLEEGNMKPVVAISYWNTSVEQFSLINLPYVVYDPANSTASITPSVNGISRPTLSVGRTQQTWSYRPEESGALTLAIACGDAKDYVNLSIAPNSLDVKAEENALALYLNAYGRSNNEDNPGTWISGDVEAKFTNFNFVSDGWLQDENGVTVLRVGGQARVEIPYKIFSEDARATGKTIEIEFTARNVMDYEAPIITCWSGDTGLYMTAQKGTLRSQQASVFAQYKEDERVRLSFVVTRTNAHRLLQVYINGIMSGAVRYATNDNFSQLDPVNISIGSTDATVDIYCIRVYDMDLSRQQVLRNWIADTPNLTEKAERFQRNNIFDEYGQIIISKLPEDLPYMVLAAPKLPQYKGNKVGVHGSYTDPVYSSKSFTFNGAEADVQGTTSAGYARKNYKVKFNGGFTKGGVPVEDYQLGNSVPTDTFTFKADVASSEGANNVELVKLYNDICPYKTPPQLQDPRVRQGIDGYPIVIFHDDGSKVTFMGKYNFNHDKGTPEVFGLDADDESWETRNSSGDYALWKSSDFSGDGWKADYEARHPDKNTNTANLQAVAAWVASTDTEQATGEALAEAKTYNGVTYAFDTKEYRLAKFDAELGDWFNEESTIFYYLFTEFFLLTDSRAKNSFPTLYDNGVWCWLPYDMDTALGINNMGELTFGYSLEDIDFDKDTPVFNGHYSVLWQNLRTTRYNDIKDMYRRLKSSNSLVYEDVVERFEKHQAKWPEAIFNEDAYYKYIQPTVENDGDYLSMLQGSKSTQRKWWLYNRFQYMESKYGSQVDAETTTGAMRDSAIQVRGNKKATIKVKLYADAYATVDFGGNPQTKRAKRGEVHSFVCPNEKPSEFETYFYPSAQVADVGDLSDYYVSWAQFGPGVRLQRIKLGAEVGADGLPYRNENLRFLSLGTNTLLKSLDVTNCSGLGGNIDVSGCTNIEEVYLKGTSLDGVTLPNGGVIKKLHLPGTLSNLTIKNHPLLTEFTIEDPVRTSTGLLPITEMVLENAGPAIPILDLLQNTRDGAFLRLTGLNLHLENGFELEELKARLDKMQGKDEYGNNITGEGNAQVSGDIWVEHLLEYQLAEFQAAYPELTVHFNKYSVFTVNYYAGDKLMQSVANVAWGGTPTYSGATPTMPGVSDPENYEFVGWYPVPQFVEYDMNVSAVFAPKNLVALNLLNNTLSGSYTNDRVTKVRPGAFFYSNIETLRMANCSSDISLRNGLFKEAYVPNALGEMYGCWSCRNLAVLDIKAFSGSTYMFKECSKLRTLILRKNDGVAFYSGTRLCINETPIASGDGYIYVPATMVETYKNHASWSTWANQIRAIEDYPDITGG